MRPRDMNHPYSQNYLGNSCDMCGAPCYPMKVGADYLCDVCVEFMKKEREEKEAQRNVDYYAPGGTFDNLTGGIE